MDITTVPFDVGTLRSAMDRGDINASQVIREAYRRIRDDDWPGVWISLKPEEQALAELNGLEAVDRRYLPLYGIPFAVKDNIDAAGLVTTAACPAFAYSPPHSAHVVAKLERAGAICIGKTNLDQFATGLNGTRSPYGACASAFDARYVAGGSSSGSAVAVALQQVAFALGTDTGGSGRVPAGLNNVVGLKPSLGTLSTLGLVPNCRTLDCVSVFALTIQDAAEVAQLCVDAQVEDPSLSAGASTATFLPSTRTQSPRFAVPRGEDREFFGNVEGQCLFEAQLARLKAEGASLVEVDFRPFLEAGRLMFEGPWIAERMAAVGEFITTHSSDVLPLTRAIIEKSTAWSAADAFEALYRLRELRLEARLAMTACDALLVPTVATLYTIEEMLAEPVLRNTHHGHYSYYANMLDFCALAVPAAFYANGMPFGVTLLAPSLSDARLAALGQWMMALDPLACGRPRTMPS